MVNVAGERPKDYQDRELKRHVRETSQGVKEVDHYHLPAAGRKQGVVGNGEARQLAGGGLMKGQNGALDHDSRSNINGGKYGMMEQPSPPPPPPRSRIPFQLSPTTDTAAKTMDSRKVSEIKLVLLLT